MGQAGRRATGQDLYGEVTARIIAEMEEGRLPWVRPGDETACGCAMPANAVTGRAYSGINVLILWVEGFERGYRSQRWLTYRQALAAGGHVRRGETGTGICYADRFTPRGERERASDEDREARRILFLKRFTVFNADQCDDLPEDAAPALQPVDPADLVPPAERLIAATGADLRIGGTMAFYAPAADFIAIPSHGAFREPINWYRTAFHELGHWTGHPRRLARDQSGVFGSEAYAREELVAELASAFVCATLSIQPTVRHADYLGCWLDLLRADDRAIFKAASLASKAADHLLGFRRDPPAR